MDQHPPAFLDKNLVIRPTYDPENGRRPPHVEYSDLMNNADYICKALPYMIGLFRGVQFVCHSTSGANAPVYDRFIERFGTVYKYVGYGSDFLKRHYAEREYLIATIKCLTMNEAPSLRQVINKCFGYAGNDDIDFDELYKLAIEEDRKNIKQETLESYQLVYPVIRDLDIFYAIIQNDVKKRKCKDFK